MDQENEFSLEDIHAAMFAQLVMMFTSATLQHLGKLVNPASNKAEVNLEAAQASIDMLDMLETKTRGNLKPDEDRMLKESLTQLKLNYVETQQAAGVPPPSAPAALCARRLRKAGGTGIARPGSGRGGHQNAPGG